MKKFAVQKAMGLVEGNLKKLEKYSFPKELKEEIAFFKKLNTPQTLERCPKADSVHISKK